MSANPIQDDDFLSTFEELRREFRENYGRDFVVTGEDTPEHLKLHGAGNARDVRVRDLPREQSKWLVDRGRARGLDVRDFSWVTKPVTTSTGVKLTGPHIHFQRRKNSPAQSGSNFERFLKSNNIESEPAQPAAGIAQSDDGPASSPVVTARNNSAGEQPETNFSKFLAGAGISPPSASSPNQARVAEATTTQMSGGEHPLFTAAAEEVKRASGGVYDDAKAREFLRSEPGKKRYPNLPRTKPPAAQPPARVAMFQSRIDALTTEIDSLAQNRNRLTAAGFNQDPASLASIDNAINQRARERAQLQAEIESLKNGTAPTVPQLKSQLSQLETSRAANLRRAASSTDEREQRQYYSIANQENDRAQLLKHYIDIEESGQVAHPALREHASRPVVPEHTPSTWEKISGGVGAGAANVFAGLDQLGANLFNSDALRQRAEQYHNLAAISSERAGPGLTPALAGAIAQAGLLYGPFRAVGELGQVIGPGVGIGEVGGEATALGLYGAAERAHEGLLPSLEAGLTNAAMVPGTRAVSGAALPTRAGVGFLSGFLPAYYASGNLEDAIAQGLVAAGMGAAGKEKQPADGASVGAVAPPVASPEKAVSSKLSEAAAINYHPIDASLVEQYKLNLPEGYAREGSQYVYRQGTSSSEAASRIENFPVRDIEADPARFQYKLNAGESSGASRTFGKDAKFDPSMVKDNPLLVWRDPADGKTYIIDGHNRLNLAKRDNVESVPVEFINARTAEEAKTVGAIKNILAGNGSEKDAAAFFKENNLTREDVARLASDNNLQPLNESALKAGPQAEMPEPIAKPSDDVQVSLISDESATGMTPGRSGTTSLSNEELARTERFFKVGKGSSVTSLGKQPDAPLKSGEAVIAIGPDGRARVVNSSGPVDEALAIRKAQDVLREQSTLSVNEQAMQKATPELVQQVENTPLREIADKSGLDPRSATKGVNDVLADGVREFSGEATAVKRAMLKEESGDVVPRTSFETFLEKAGFNQKGSPLAQTGDAAGRIAGSSERIQGKAVNVSGETRAALDQHKLPADEITRAASSAPIAGEPEFVRTARERLRQSLAGNQLNVNPLGALRDTAIITGYDVFKATMNRADWAREMTLRLGQKVKPILDEVWDHLTSGKFGAADVKRRLEQTRLVPTSLIEEALSGNRPEHVNGIVDFLAGQRKKIVDGAITASDVARAYVMTVASQGSDAVKVSTLKSKLEAAGIKLEIPDEYATRNKAGEGVIRPEDAMGMWLQSPRGQAALEALEAGRFDPAAWNEAAKVRATFGDDRLRNRNVFGDKGGNGYSLRNLTKLIPLFNGAKGNPETIGNLVSRLNGVGTGKTPFMKMLLGFGESPTIDAVEINAWLTGRGTTRGQAGREVELARAVKDFAPNNPGLMSAVSDRINRRFNDLRKSGVVGSDLSKEDFGAVVHHWLWDKMKGTTNPQRGLYDAMKAEPEFVVRSRARLRESLSGNRTNANPVQDIYDAAVVTGYDIYRSVKDFSQWSKQMLDEFGESVKPHLEKIWQQFESSKPADNPDASPQTASMPADGPAGNGKRWLRLRDLPEDASLVLKQFMLSGVQTSARNVLSTLSHIAAEGGPTRAIASVVDMVTSWGTGERTVTRPSPVQATRSAIEAATTGVREAWEIIKRGTPDNELERLANSREISTGSHVGDRIANFVFRGMAAQDRIMKTYAFNEALQDRARAEALTEKKAGRINAESVEAHAAELMRAAKEGRREDLIMNSWQDAEIATFNNENRLGKVLNYTKLTSSGIGRAALDQAFLFVSVPWNVIRRQMDAMGLGFGVEATKAAARAIQGKAFPTSESQRNFAKAAGRLGTGVTIAMLGGALRKAGVMTGYNEEGDKPKASILIGGRWYKVGWLGPFGAILSLGATLQGEMEHELAKDERGNLKESRAGRVAGAAAESLLPQHPFARPLMETVEPVIEAARKRSFGPLEKTGESLAGRLVPAISAEVARSMDTKERETRGPVDAMKARIPGLREELPAKRDGLGREVERAGAPGVVGGMADVFKSVPDKAATDPIVRELQEHGLELKPVQQGRDETDAHFQRRADALNRIIEERLTALIESPAYKESSAGLKKLLLADVRNGAKKDYREKAKGGKIADSGAAAWNIEVRVAELRAKEELKDNSAYKALRPADRESVDRRVMMLFRPAKAKRLSDVKEGRAELREITREMKSAIKEIIRDVKEGRDDEE